MAGARHAEGEGGRARKSLHQRPRSRLVPLPEYAEAFIAETAFGAGSLLDALLRRTSRERTGLPCGAPTSSTSSCRRTC